MKKKAVVLGLGLSGISACSYLLKKGFSIIACDDNPKKILPDTLSGDIVQFSTQDAIKNLHDAQLVCTSPGILPSHPLLVEAAKRNIDTVVDIELALRSRKGTIVGITGSNGKTTVTSLVTHILKECGKDAKAVGNIEIPILDDMDHDILVVEMSSFQLKRCSTPALTSAVVLNITPNHLNYHPSFEDYQNAKMHIQELLLPAGTFYIHENLFSQEAFTFGFKEKAAISSNGKSTIRFEQEEIELPKSLQGVFTHDVLNFLAAYAICRDLHVSPERCVQAYSTFQKPPHRIQYLKKHQGVQYIDDSKATSVDAVMKALESVPGPIVLIAGGVHKGEAYHQWKEFQHKIKSIIAIGEAAPLIEKDLSKYVAFTLCKNLEDAVQHAAKVAKGGESVLLSPGCSSYDMYNNYKERGEHFQKLVNLLCP